MLVYCFTHNITSAGQTAECPPHTFKLNATIGFNTSDGYVYSPGAVEFSASVELTTELNSVHFKNSSITIDENFAIKKVIAMRAELERTRKSLYLLSWHSGGGISYPVFSVAYGLVGLGMGYVTFAIWRSRRSERRQAKSAQVTAQRQKEEAEMKHLELKRIISDSIYGQRVYETLSRKNTTFIQVNATGQQTVPTTTNPLPPTPRP